MKLKKGQSNHRHQVFIIVLLALFSCSESKRNLDQASTELNCNGLHWASLPAGKNDELYFGVDNEIRLIAPAISSGDILMAFSGGKGTIRRVEGPLFHVKPTSFEDVTITLKNMNSHESKDFSFRVKEQPTPFPSLYQDNIQIEGEIESTDFREIKRIYLSFADFNYAGDCMVETFQLSLIQNGSISQTEENIGAAFSKNVLSLVSKVDPDDTVLFTAIKGKCAGDTVSRNLPPMIWEII